MLKRFIMMTMANLLVLTMLSGQSIGFEFGGGTRSLLLTDQLNEAFDTPITFGLSIGANALIPLGSQKLQLMPAIRYITKGGDMKVEDNLRNDDNAILDGPLRLNYFEIAPQLLFRFNEDYKGFFLNAGPTLDIGVGGDCKLCGAKPEFGTSDSDNFSAMSLGLVAGAGLIKTNEETSRTFFMNVNIGIGLADIQSQGQQGNSLLRDTFTGKMTNFYIGLNFGYLFPLYTH